MQNSGIGNAVNPLLSLAEGIEKMKKTPKSAMVIFIKQGSHNNLGRPLLSPHENKKILMENLIK